MCGRFALTLPSEAMAQLFDATPANDLPDVPNFNICPTNAVHSVISDGTTRRLIPMRWGFLPHWYKTPSGGPLLINARAESIAEKPAFRAACRERRCLIPATGFYEWTKDPDDNRLPWYIQRADQAPLVFAGIWQDWEKEGQPACRTCAIVTTSANAHLSAIHHRQPVTLEPEDWPLWLGEKGKGAARLMQAAPDDALTYYRVSTRINSNRTSGADLIAPVDPASGPGDVKP